MRESGFEADPVRSGDVWASHSGVLCSFGAENGFLRKAGRPRARWLSGVVFLSLDGDRR